MSFNESRFRAFLNELKYASLETTELEPENTNVFVSKFVLENLKEIEKNRFPSANVCYVYVQCKILRACFPISCGERGSKRVRT